jgi:hypothetical protein
MVRLTMPAGSKSHISLSDGDGDGAKYKLVTVKAAQHAPFSQMSPNWTESGDSNGYRFSPADEGVATATARAASVCYPGKAVSFGACL